MKSEVTLLILVCFCGVFGELIETKIPKVHYSNGWVVGKTFTTANLKEFDGFLGIPFAKPPVDDLRLRDPQPFKGIFTESNPYLAIEEKPFCAQKNYLLPNPVVMGVEDCLYLYVYRPKNKLSRKTEKLLPVIVFIHGGAFFSGAAGPSITGADYIMDTEEVVFVTMSYRLGPLGFLSTGDENMSGNFGLKDQALALQWVKNNIEKFGGDPNNVALMGQSAGAASVHLHMMSSMSKNLFHKAIILSGNGNGPYAYVLKDPMQQAQAFAKAAGIKAVASLTKSQLSDELRNVDVESLINASDSFKIWSIDPLVISKPVVENCSAVDGFLCDDPVKIWQSGNYNRIPLLTGFMDGDGGVRALSYFTNQTLLKELNDKFRKLFPKLLEIEDLMSERITENHLEMVVDKYFDGRYKLVDEDLKALVKVYTYRSFAAPLTNTLLQMLKNDRKSMAYLYKFSFEGMYSYSMLYTGTFKKFGAVHCDELIYLLKSPAIFPVDFAAGSREAVFREKFIKFFTSFAAQGKPQRMSGKTLHRCTINEMLGTGSKQLRCNYIDFNDKISVKYDDAIDYSTVDFWNQIDDTLVAK